MDLRFVLPEIYGPQDQPTDMNLMTGLSRTNVGGRPVSPRCAARGKEQARGNRFLRLSSVCTKSLHGRMHRESFQDSSGQEKNSESLRNSIGLVFDEVCMA